MNKLTHGYGDGKYKTLFQDVDIQVDRGNRVGFVGPNGSGKSTMMRIIAGNEQPRSGYAEFGSGNVILNYFQQNQADELDLDKTGIHSFTHSLTYLLTYLLTYSLTHSLTQY